MDKRGAHRKGQAVWLHPSLEWEHLGSCLDGDLFGSFRTTNENVHITWKKITAFQIEKNTNLHEPWFQSCKKMVSFSQGSFTEEAESTDRSQKLEEEYEAIRTKSQSPQILKITTSPFLHATPLHHNSQYTDKLWKVRANLDKYMPSPKQQENHCTRIDMEKTLQKRRSFPAVLAEEIPGSPPPQWGWSGLKSRLPRPVLSRAPSPLIPSFPS